MKGCAYSCASPLFVVWSKLHVRCSYGVVCMLVGPYGAPWGRGIFVEPRPRFLVPMTTLGKKHRKSPINTVHAFPEGCTCTMSRGDQAYPRI